MTEPKVSYKTTDEVDFVIIGSGAAGGVLAKELSTNGFSVVVLEQGPYLTENDFHMMNQNFNQHLITNLIQRCSRYIPRNSAGRSRATAGAVV
jgi:choline dehydrogenase-like flavoprotein